MKIAENKTKIPIHKLQAGDVFRSPVNGYLYMKTSPKFDEKGARINAINLETGTLYSVDQYNEVIPIDCELVIK